MARSRVPFQAVHPYHVTARCINRDWFQIPMEEVWRVMSEQLYFIQNAFGLKVTCFVLMHNHFHMIVNTPNENLDSAMRWFMRETSRSLVSAGNRINQTYGGRYFRSILDSDLYYLHAYKYVYRNPVQAGLATGVLEYPFSSLPRSLGLLPLEFPLYDYLMETRSEETLQWLDIEPRSEHWQTVRRALRRRLFRLPRVQKEPHPLERRCL